MSEESDKKLPPDKPVWTIPVRMGSAEEDNPDGGIRVPDNIIVTNLEDKKPIVCSECPCLGKPGTCYFVFQSVCTEDDQGEATWSEPELIDITCVVIPVIEEEWFGTGTTGVVNMYVPATREYLPEGYYDLPWLAYEGYESSLSPNDPVYCDVDDGICDILEKADSSMVEKPEFEKCCQATSAYMELTELNYEIYTGSVPPDKVEEVGYDTYFYKVYEEVSKEDAELIFSESTGSNDFVEVMVTGNVRGCLIARVTYPDECLSNTDSEINYIEYDISGPAPRRFKKGQLKKESYDEGETGYVVSEIIPVPPNCTFEVFLYAADDELNLAGATSDYNEETYDEANQHSAFIGCSIFIDWCPYQYYLYMEGWCKEGAGMVKLPGCEAPYSQPTALMRSYNGRTEEGDPVGPGSGWKLIIEKVEVDWGENDDNDDWFDNEDFPIEDNEWIDENVNIGNDPSSGGSGGASDDESDTDVGDDTAQDNKYRCMAIVNGPEVLRHAEEFGRGESLGECLSYLDEGKLSAFIYKHHVSGRAMGNIDYIKTVQSTYSPTCEGKKSDTDSSADSDSSGGYSLPVYGSKETCFICPSADTVDPASIFSEAEFTDMGPILLGGCAGGESMTPLPEKCCGTFSTVIETWTNNCVLDPHTYQYKAKNCKLVCPNSLVKLLDVGPRDCSGRCTERSGPIPEAWGQGENAKCPEIKPNAEPLYGCSQRSYWSEYATSTTHGLVGAIGDHGEKFLTCYCYDGYMEIHAYCDGHSPKKPCNN